MRTETLPLEKISGGISVHQLRVRSHIVMICTQTHTNNTVHTTDLAMSDRCKTRRLSTHTHHYYSEHAHKLASQHVTCTEHAVIFEGYDTGLLGVRDFRISVISNWFPAFAVISNWFPNWFPASWLWRISQMRMRERSTAHAQTKRGCFSLFLVISRWFPDFYWVLISDF